MVCRVPPTRTVVVMLWFSFKIHRLSKTQNAFKTHKCCCLILRTLKDIACNMVWLRPIVAEFPDRIPSQFYLVDCLLHLDFLLNDKLLLHQKPEKHDGVSPWTTRGEKVEMARIESSRIKRLLGALRYLWRNGTL